MAKKKPTHQQNSTDPQQDQTKMDPKQPTAIEEPAEKEKLSSLKSLNALLLKETVEKRQEVSALLESKKSLESELTRSVSEVEALKSELTRMEESGLEAEVRKGVVSAFVESKMGIEVDSTRRENEELRKRLEDIEREMGEVVNERDEMEKSKIEGDLEIGSLKKLENELRSEIKRERQALNQAIRDNDLMKQDFEIQVEVGNTLRKKIAEIEAKEKRTIEELEELGSKYQLAVKELEDSKNKVEATMIELGLMVRNCDELQREIEGLKGEKELIMREKAELEKERIEQEGKINELDKEVSGLNAIVLSLREDEEKWRVKFFKLEKVNDEMGEKMEDLGRELNLMLEENKEKEMEIKSLIGEKSSAMKRVSELEEDLEGMKRLKEEILEEKNWLEEVKSKQKNEILELQNKVSEIMSNLSLLQESNSDQIEKNKRFLSEINGHKSALDRVTLERDEAKKNLEEEKMNGMKLQVKVSEISKKMEETSKVIEGLREASSTLVGEKKELENKYSKLVEEKGLTEKKFADTQMKITDLEIEMRSKTDLFESAMEMLKNTALQLSMADEKKGEEDEGMGVNERAINGEIEPCLAEIEAIRAAFRRREEKVGEMKQEMESLKWSVMEARKKKSFWTLVSSATTILAAVVSFAYAARVR